MAIENREALATRHRTDPGTPDGNGTIRCIVDGFRVYRVKGGAWRHDMSMPIPMTGFPTREQRA